MPSRWSVLRDASARRIPCRCRPERSNRSPILTGYPGAPGWRLWVSTGPVQHLQKALAMPVAGMPEDFFDPGVLL